MADNTGSIKDIHLPFRDDWIPASFRNVQFFAEMTSRDNGRRIITHEFPKKDIPYSEDMGRRAKTFSIRAYFITYPMTLDGSKGDLYNIDYRIPRDKLLKALEQNGPGKLILSTLPSENVVVTRYRLSEEDRLGGYCTFDIEFTEYGTAPQTLIPSINTNIAASTAADTVREQVKKGMAGGDAQKPPTPTPPGTPGSLMTEFNARFFNSQMRF